MQKASLKDLTWENREEKRSKIEESLEKVNDVIEATPLLTEKIDVKSLNQLTYAAAITAIKTGCVENDCIIKKRNINRRKGDWTLIWTGE